MIRDPNAPANFGENLGRRVSHELQAIADGLQHQRLRLSGSGSDIRIKKRHSQRSPTGSPSAGSSDSKGKERVRSPLTPSSPPPHIVITGDESEDEEGWSSEDNDEEGGKADASKSKSKRSRIAHFMGKKKRRSSFRGGREAVHFAEEGRPRVVEEEERRGRERPSLAHRRLGSDIAGGLTVESARPPGRISTRESSPARSVRFQDGNRPSHAKQDSQKSG